MAEGEDTADTSAQQITEPVVETSSEPVAQESAPEVVPAPTMTVEAPTPVSGGEVPLEPTGLEPVEGVERAERGDEGVEGMKRGMKAPILKSQNREKQPRLKSRPAPCC